MIEITDEIKKRMYKACINKLFNENTLKKEDPYILCKEGTIDVEEFYKRETENLNIEYVNDIMWDATLDEKEKEITRLTKRDIKRDLDWRNRVNPDQYNEYELM